MKAIDILAELAFHAGKVGSVWNVFKLVSFHTQNRFYTFDQGHRTTELFSQFLTSTISFVIDLTTLTFVACS